MNSVIVTRDGDIIYNEASLVEWLSNAGIDTEDMHTVGAWLNCAENIQAAKDEIDSDMRCYECALDEWNSFANELYNLIDDKLKQKRLTDMRGFLRGIQTEIDKLL